MSYDKSSITVNQLIMVLFCFLHRKSRRVQNSTFCMFPVLWFIVFVRLMSETSTAAATVVGHQDYDDNDNYNYNDKDN